MKTAFIISGHMRTYVQNVFNHRHYLYRWYPDADFYVSTISDHNTQSVNLLKQFYPESKIHINVVDKQPSLPEPYEPMRFEGTVRSASAQGVLRQFWQNKQAWEFYKQHNQFHEQIIRLRPDSFFHTFHKPITQITENEIWAPWWGKCGGINDRFAIMGSKAAEKYFTAFDHIPHMLDIGAPLQSEALMLFHLQLSNYNITERLKTEFSTTDRQDDRPNCDWPIFGNISNRNVIIRFPEIRTEDVAYLNL
jgi:hypothetical protein